MSSRLGIKEVKTRKKKKNRRNWSKENNKNIYIFVGFLLVSAGSCRCECVSRDYETINCLFQTVIENRAKTYFHYVSTRQTASCFKQLLLGTM